MSQWKRLPVWLLFLKSITGLNVFIKPRSDETQPELRQFYKRNPTQTDLWFTLAVTCSTLLTLCGSHSLIALFQHYFNKNIWLPRGGSTQTGLALKYILRKGFPGGRNSTAAARIVILLSDGRSQGNVVQAAATLKETGVVLFAVGLRYPRYVWWLVANINTLNYLFAIKSLKRKKSRGGR